MVKLKPTPLTPDNFRAYGQIVGPTPDGASFGPDDAQLRLTAGIPRLYIMRLENRPLRFGSITHHASVTQCLGSVGGLPWYIGVAKPSIVDSAEEPVDVGSTCPNNRKCNSVNAARSHVGHYYVPPSPDQVQVFRVEGPQFLKFHVGTWHAGPLFKERTMDFYNLELADTNVVDHTTHMFTCDNQVLFAIDD